MIRVVTGGARSGKSSFAESFYREKEGVVYIATSLVEDQEMENRVRLHQESRPASWRTFEGYRDLSRALGEESFYLLDCVTVMTSNIMFEMSQGLDRISGQLEAEIEASIIGELELLIKDVRARGYDLTLVTNEVGSSIVPEYHISRVFRDIQGRVNQALAQMADEAYLVALGLPVRLK